MTNNTAPATTDELYLLDDPTGTPADNRITVANLLKSVNSLTEDTSPDRTADYILTYDASAGASKKVLMGTASASMIALNGLLSGNGQNPSDSTTYYFGSGATALSLCASEGYNKFYVPTACRMRTIYIQIVVSGTLGTTEQGSLAFRKNATTSTTISSAVQADATSQTYSTDLDVSMAAGDFFEILWATPAWSTNPTTVTLNGSVAIDFT